MDVVAELRAAGCVFAEEEAALLGEAATGTAFEDLVRRRCAGEPLEHLLGFVDFCGRRYRVSPGVFVPRQRSTLLVEAAAAHGGSSILDLCCGCGALGLAIRRQLGGETRLVAADLDPAAVADARANGVGEAYAGDLFEPLPDSLRKSVDVLVANTPYVPSGAIATMPPEARDHEPRAALDGGADGTDIQRRVLAGAADWLAPDGVLLTETSTRQAPLLRSAAAGLGWSPRILVDDDRGATVLVARLSQS